MRIKLFDLNTHSVAHLDQQDYVKYFGKLNDENLPKKTNYQVQIKLFDPNTNSVAHLDQQHYVNYFGILNDKNLSWKYHIDYVASKISRTIGIIARLSYFIR